MYRPFSRLAIVEDSEKKLHSYTSHNIFYSEKVHDFLPFQTNAWSVKDSKSILVIIFSSNLVAMLCVLIEECGLLYCFESLFFDHFTPFSKRGPFLQNLQIQHVFLQRFCGTMKLKSPSSLVFHSFFILSASYWYAVYVHWMYISFDLHISS